MLKVARKKSSKQFVHFQIIVIVGLIMVVGAAMLFAFNHSFQQRVLGASTFLSVTNEEQVAGNSAGLIPSTARPAIVHLHTDILRSIREP